MKKILPIIISRGFIVTLSVFIQVFFWFLIVIIFKDYTTLLSGLMLLISFCCVLNIIVKDIYPEHKIAWIIFMFLFPVAGGMFYLLFGSHRMSSKTKKLSKTIELNIQNEAKKIKEINQDKLGNVNLVRQHNYLKTIASAPAFENTSVEYFSVGDNMWTSMLEELEKAEKFIFIESFIIEQGKMWGAIEKILINKAKNGVDVRVLFDDLGCLLTLPSNFIKRLKSNNIDCRVFNKVNQLINANFNNRDHRKICVIDGNVGFNGGVNLADEYINEKKMFGHWKDTAVMLKGEGVYGLTLMFLSMWDMQTKAMSNYQKYAPTIKMATDGIVQPFADNPLDNESVGESVYMNMLNTAEKYVYITSPYLIITREMTTALANAAKSGIDVRLILPGIPDKKIIQFLSRSYYAPLVEAGVKVYEYTPGFIHSKMFITDDITSVVGTINLDYRSLNLHYECGTMLYNCSVIKDIKKDFIETQNKCKQIYREDISKNSKMGAIKFFVLAVLKVFSPLM